MDSDTDTPHAGGTTRYCCPFPGCNRSFRDFWRLKVHYRAAPDARGSGVERGHGVELPVCPLCRANLGDVKYHKCTAPGTHRARRRSSSAGGQQQQELQQLMHGGMHHHHHHPLVVMQPGAWPQHLSVSTVGPLPPAAAYGHVTAARAATPPGMAMQAAAHHPAATQGLMMMQQHHSMPLAGAAAAGADGYGLHMQQPTISHAVSPHAYIEPRPLQHQQSMPQHLPQQGWQAPQQQQHHHQQQHYHAAAASAVHPVVAAAPPGVDHQQHHHQQQHHHHHQHHHHQQQFMHAAAPGMPTYEPPHQQQHHHHHRHHLEQQEQACRLSPVITLPESALCQAAHNHTVYRPLPRQSGDGGFAGAGGRRVSDGCLTTFLSDWHAASAAAAAAAATMGVSASSSWQHWQRLSGTGEAAPQQPQQPQQQQLASSNTSCTTAEWAASFALQAAPGGASGVAEAPPHHQQQQPDSAVLAAAGHTSLDGGQAALTAAAGAGAAAAAAEAPLSSCVAQIVSDFKEGLCSLRSSMAHSCSAAARQNSSGSSSSPVSDSAAPPPIAGEGDGCITATAGVVGIKRQASASAAATPAEGTGQPAAKKHRTAADEGGENSTDAAAAAAAAPAAAGGGSPVQPGAAAQADACLGTQSGTAQQQPPFGGVDEALTSRPSSSLSSASRGTTDTPPPTEAQEALLQLADGGIGAQGVASLPAGLDAAAEDLTEQLLLQLLPAAPVGNACGEQQHRAHVAQLIKRAVGTASAAGMFDSAPLWQEVMGALVEHAAALHQLESPGTEAAVVSDTAVEAVEPPAPAVTACAHPTDGAGSEQAAASLTAAAG